MFFNKYRAAGNDYNECVSKGNCSTSPDIRALQEVIIIFLRQIAFYELKLNKLNISYFENKDIIIQGVLTLIAAAEYSQEQMLEIIGKIYSNMLYARKEYLDYCTEHQLNYDDLKSPIKLGPKTTLTKIIQSGERVFLSRYKKVSAQSKNLYEILVLVVKSVCRNLVRLKEYDKFDDNAYIAVLNSLNLLNYPRTSAKKIKYQIDNIAFADKNLTELLSKCQEEKFGYLTDTLVSQSTTPGRAILVSGTNLYNLYDVLEISKDLDIDVYTHADLLIAHSFSEFKKFKNLKGHYGSCLSNCVLDFATFPGAILLTKNTYPNMEYLYRGKLFSAEDLAPHGVIPVKNDDYTPLFEAALKAKGFTKGRQVASITVGYDEEILFDKLKSICDRFNSGEIEYLILIGLSDYTQAQEEYFKHLYRFLPQKSYIITFSHHFGGDNELYINLANNMPEVYKIILKIFTHIDITSDKIYFFFSKCDASSISNMITLSNLNAKHLNLSLCPPYIINPNILTTLKTIYNILPTTTPATDAERLFLT